MRSNIDLTSNQMFSSDRRTSNRLAMARLVARRTFGRRSIDSLFGLSDGMVDESGIDEVLRTGNRELREEKRAWTKIESGDDCDCCGASLIRKPWNRHYGLCLSCAKRLDEGLAIGDKSRMPKHLSSKYLTMEADRAKHPFGII